MSQYLKGLLVVAVVYLLVNAAGPAFADLGGEFSGIGTAITGLVTAVTAVVGLILVAVLSLAAGRAIAKRFLKA